MPFEAHMLERNHSKIQKMNDSVNNFEAYLRFIKTSKQLHSELNV